MHVKFYQNWIRNVQVSNSLEDWVQKTNSQNHIFLKIVQEQYTYNPIINVII